MKNSIKMLGMSVILTLFVSLIGCSDADRDQVTSLKVQGVNSNLMALQLDAEHNLDVLLLPYEAVDKHKYKLNYTSSNDEVATVTEAGKITALKVGETEITITPTINQALETSFTLKVFDGNDEQLPEITSIALDPSVGEGITLNVNSAFNLFDKLIIDPATSNSSQLLFISDNTEIVTVNAEGLLVAVIEGATTIHVSSIKNPEIKKSIKVTVKQPLDIVSITLDSSISEGITILGSGTFDLLEKLIINPAISNNSQLLFTSDNEEIVSVNSAGLIISKKEGTANINVSSVKNPEANTSVKVTVKELLVDFHERTSWKVHTSHPYIEDANPAIGGQPEKLIDGDVASCLLLQKPGVNEVAALDLVYFVIEQEAEKEFNVISHTHRAALPQLRMQIVDVFGSNDNVNYTLIKDRIDLQSPGSNNTVLIDLGKTAKYKYVKVAATQWNATSGMTLQVAEFNIGLKKAE